MTSRDRAARIAERARVSFGGSGCGGVVFVSESPIEWRFRWVEGFAAKDEGIIVVEKRTDAYWRELPTRVF